MFEVRSPHRDKTFLCLVIFQFVVCPHVPKSWSSTMQNATIIWSASQLIVVIRKKWNMKIQLKQNLKEWYTLKHKNEAITINTHELNFIISTKTNYKDYFNKKNNYTSASVLWKLVILSILNKRQDGKTLGGSYKKYISFDTTGLDINFQINLSCRAS